MGSAGLERIKPGEMRAIRARGRGQIGLAVEQERHTLVLHRGRESLGEGRSACAHWPAATAEQAAATSAARALGNKRRQARQDRGLRGYEIEARGGAPRFGRISSGRHDEVRMPPQSGGFGGFIPLQPYERVKSKESVYRPGGRRPRISPPSMRATGYGRSPDERRALGDRAIRGAEGAARPPPHSLRSAATPPSSPDPASIGPARPGCSSWRGGKRRAGRRRRSRPCPTRPAAARPAARGRS